MRMVVVSVMGLLLMTVMTAAAQRAAHPAEPVSPDSLLSSRVELSAGMGVEYVSAPDVVNYVNSVYVFLATTERAGEFKAGVGFFGALAYPLTPDWILKAEYVYFLASYNASTPFGSSDVTLTIHMPSLIIQRVLWDERLYDLKVGIGLGYHFAGLSTKYSVVADRMTGNGPGAVVDLEANTAFGDHLFAYLGGDVRFEFIGKLKGTSFASQGSKDLIPTVNAFSIGARLGFSYYF